MSNRFIVSLNDLVFADDLEKASFGGDRSAAGRYAAEQRWKGHVKVGAQPAVVIRDAQLLDAIGQGQSRDDEPTPEMQAIAAELNKRLNLATLVLLWDVGMNASEGQRRAVDEMLKDPAISSARNLKELREAGQAFADRHADHPNAADYKYVSERFNKANRQGYGIGPDWFPPEEYTGENAAKRIPWFVTEKWNYDNQRQPFAYYLRRALADEFGVSISGKPETPGPKDAKEVYEGSQVLQTAMRVVVRAFYENTQEQLKRLSPATHVVLYRGTSTPNDPSPPKSGTVPLRGVTSWSGEKEVGQGWSLKEGSALLEAAIPFSQIFATPRSGFGRPHNELGPFYAPLSEYLVLGPSVEATVEITGPKPPSADLQKAQVRRDAMVAAAFAKASFGGDRSAAGRYAAEQRWKGHVKQDNPKGRDFKEIIGTFTTVKESFQGRVKRDAKGLSDEELQREFGAIDPVAEPTLEEQTYAGWKKQALAELISERKIERARGGIVEHVRRFGGMSVKIESGEQPVDGFMVARKEHSRIVTAEDFYDETEGKRIMADFLKENRSRFGKDQFLGIWHNKKNGMVYLDITDNVRDRTEAERLGAERNQISIWDVVNEAEIDTGGTGEG